LIEGWKTIAHTHEYKHHTTFHQTSGWETGDLVSLLLKKGLLLRVRLLACTRLRDPPPGSALATLCNTLLNLTTQAPSAPQTPGGCTRNRLDDIGCTIEHRKTNRTQQTCRSRRSQAGRPGRRSSSPTFSVHVWQNAGLAGEFTVSEPERRQRSHLTCSVLRHTSPTGND
jgi:hypothetical protein